jgi:hypothetical protein
MHIYKLVANFVQVESHFPSVSQGIVNCHEFLLIQKFLDNLLTISNYNNYKTKAFVYKMFNLCIDQTNNFKNPNKKLAHHLN